MHFTISRLSCRRSRICAEGLRSVLLPFPYHTTLPSPFLTLYQARTGVGQGRWVGAGNAAFVMMHTLLSSALALRKKCAHECFVL